jgi:hypothetical protein
MKYLRIFSVSVLLLLTKGFANGQSLQKSFLPELQSFSNEKAILDLRNSPWQYVHDTTNMATFEEVVARKDWSSIKVGKSWNMVGHSELRKGTVWVRTRVFIPMELKNSTVSFFCTAVGDVADLMVNGSPVGERIRYDWWIDCPGSAKIEVTNKLVFGEENIIMLRCGIVRPNRSIGLLGLVALQRSIPFTRNSDGGIVLINDAEGQFNILLHYGDAILSQGNKTGFSAKELSSLQVPVYALREDEMICVVPTGQVDISNKYKVDLSLIHNTSDNRPVTIKCGELQGTQKQFDLITIPLQVTAKYNNPFEQREIDVTAEILTPSGKIEIVRGFFAQDYKSLGVGDNEEILLPVEGLGTPWRLNYRPREAGRFKIYLNARDQFSKATYYVGSIEVLPKENQGYLRVSKKDPRYFDFDNGETLYATGPSGWFRQKENWIFGGNTRWVPVEQVKKFYERKFANRSTYEYLARWHFGQLYLKGGFIDAYVAWKLESAIRSMESNGIYWITYGKPAAGRTYFNNFNWGMNTMCLQSQIIRQNGLPGFTELGFEQGGRIELDHFVSRWADSPAIWMWNCAEEDGTFNADVLPYHAYIRSIDVYKHPHGVSEGVEGVMYGGDAIILPDWYSGSYEKCLQTYLPLVNHQCPVIDIEGSVNSGGDLYNMGGERLKKIEDGYHNHLWLCLFMKMAGGGTDWFNVELDANNMLFHAMAISNYLDGEYLAGMKMASPVVSEKDLDAFALTSIGKSLAWMIIPPSKRGKSVTTFFANIPVEKDGKYSVEIWDTRKAEVIRKVECDSFSGTLNLRIDNFATDIALKATLK